MITETGVHGWLLVDKPLGPTSAQVVGRLKWAFREGGYGRVKIGHGGTLDPLASGLLPIALGEATKLVQYVLDGRKQYRFRLALGAETSTDDAEGEITNTSDVRPSKDALLSILPQFRGKIAQRPPAYSALKVDGKRAYQRARAGEDIVMAERQVEIFALDLLSIDDSHAEFQVDCSKGTYVRSLARDIARAAGTLGHVAELRRTGAATFSLQDAVVLDKIVELVQGSELEQVLLPLTAGLDDIPVLAVDPGDAVKLKHGQRLPGSHMTAGLYIATDGPVPVALVELSENDIRVVKGFNL